MDPDVLLRSIRNKQALIERWGDDTPTGKAFAVALAVDVGYLDDWLSAGGFLPGAWGKYWRGATS